MNGPFITSIALIAISLIPVSLAAKEKTVKIAVKGGNLANPIELTDPKILDNFNVWTGPGTSSNDGEGFIIQWSRGMVAEPPKELMRYQVSFYSENSSERPFYVVTYCYDAASGEGFVYLPGPGENWYSQDASAILHGVEGNWFRARSMWDVTVMQLMAKAQISVPAPQTPCSTQTPPSSISQPPKWTEADREKLLFRAQRGDRGAQFWLGAGYGDGWFGKVDLEEALKWLRKAAAQSDPDAQFSLGQMYEDGEGVEQDFVQAAEWYRKAAEHVPDLGGAGQGRYHLGMLYLDGTGVPNDYVQAYMWFKLADFESNPNLSEAKAHMTPDEILEAERLVEEWKSRHPNPSTN